MPDLTWLRQQLDTDEQVGASLSLAAATAGFADTSWPGERLIQAHRAILDLHAKGDFPYDPEDGPGDYSWTEYCDGCNKPTPCPTIKALASIYSDRDGYQETGLA